MTTDVCKFAVCRDIGVVLGNFKGMQIGAPPLFDEFLIDDTFMRDEIVNNMINVISSNIANINCMVRPYSIFCLINNTEHIPKKMYRKITELFIEQR